MKRAAGVVQEASFEDNPAVDEMPCGYLSTTPDGRILRVNATFCTWLGMDAQQLTGSRLVELLTAGSRIFHETLLIPMLRMHGSAQEITVDVVRADGTRLPVLLNATLMRSSDGEPSVVRMAVFDATQRRAYERGLVRTRVDHEIELTKRAGEAATAAAIATQISRGAADMLLFATDMDLTVTRFDRGAREALGCTAEEAAGSSTAVLFRYEDVLRHAEALGVPPELSSLVPTLVRHGVPTNWTMTTRSGGRRTMSLSFTEIHDGHGVIGYLCAGEDASDRPDSASAHAGALSRERESMARLEEAARIKVEVVSTLSHELRTPITVIQGYGQLLAGGYLGELAPAQADAVAKVLRNAVRLSSLVDDLLYLDRMSSVHEVRRGLEPVDLAALVAEAHDDLEQLTLGRDLVLELQVPAGPALVVGEPLAIGRVVSHLVGNATKFTPDGGSIVVTVAPTPAGCTLTVTDTGMGIAEADQPRVTEQFYRSSEAYRLAVPGTGLGLSVVHEIVAAHGGTMHITSEVGQGTTVTVVLPAYEEDRPPHESPDVAPRG